FMRQQDAVQTQFAKALQSSPLAAMTELTRQNLELWGRMQESMLQAFAPRKEPSDSAQSRDEPGGKPAAGRAQKTTTDEPPAPKSAQKEARSGSALCAPAVCPGKRNERPRPAAHLFHRF